MKNTEIKACPICGQQPTVTLGRRAGNGEWVALPMVRCKHCDYSKHGNSDEAAAAKWNERAGVRQPAMPETGDAKAVSSGAVLDCCVEIQKLLGKEKDFHEQTRGSSGHGVKWEQGFIEGIKHCLLVVSQMKRQSNVES
jgi:hypothetical protein